MNLGFLLASNLVTGILAISAAYLCLRKRSGWAWFLIAALLTFLWTLKVARTI